MDTKSRVAEAFRMQTSDCSKRLLDNLAASLISLVEASKRGCREEFPLTAVLHRYIQMLLILPGTIVYH
jgi:hypothetical protein